MDAPALKRAAWLGVAVLAAGAVIALAFHGHRPDSSLVGFQAAGVMLQISPETVAEVSLTRGERRWRFERGGSTAWTASPGLPLPESVAAHLDAGLRFLHVSAPQRVLLPEEVAATSPSEFGLEPPRYSVSVRSPGAAPFTIEFGTLNAQGLAQYARVTGHPEILLLPSFAGEEWEAVMAAR